MSADNEHGPQPVRVTDGEPVCGARTEGLGPSPALACTYSHGHGPLVDTEGRQWEHGIKGTQTLWTGDSLVATYGTHADPPPPGLAARSLAAMDPEGDAVQHQGGSLGSEVGTSKPIGPVADEEAP